jgi:SAM-dependent methyltransferase
MGVTMVGAAVSDLSYLLLALADVPTVHTLARRWSRWRYARLAADYDSYISRHPDYGDALGEALAVPEISPRRMLDVGAGSGFAASVLVRRFPAAWPVACDLSLPMLARARARLPHLPVVCADSGRLPFADGLFDLVVVHNAPARVGELSRLLAARGWLVAAFSHAGTLPGWLRAALIRRLRRQGLEVVRQRRVGAGWYVVAHRSETS